jgi:drug/metabolite transporter (DMT)-like permease
LTVPPVRTPPIAPLLGLGVGILAASTAALFIRFAQADGVPSLVIAALRLVIASLVLLPVVAWRERGTLQRLTRREWRLALASGVCLGVHFGAWITSLALTSVASSVVLVSTSPLFVAILAALFLRERLTGTILLGLAVTLAGAIVVGLSDACQPNGCPPLADLVRGQAFFGDLLALLGAAAGALYFSLGRVLRPKLPLLVYIFVTYGAAALVLAGAVLVAGLPVTGYPPSAYMWFLLLALVPQLVGHSAFNWALRYLPVSYVSVMSLGEPVATIAMVAVLFGDVPSATKLLGCGLILAGLAVASRRAAVTAAAPSLAT